MARRRHIVLALAAAALATSAGAAGVLAAEALRIVPSPATTGSTVIAVGTDFCPTPACPDVTIGTGAQVLATTTVAADGSFEVSFRLLLIPGQYEIVATQPAGAQPERRAITNLLVLPSDTFTPAPPGPTPVPPPPSTPPTGSAPPSEAPSPSGETGSPDATGPAGSAPATAQPSGAPPSGPPASTSGTSPVAQGLLLVVLIAAIAAGLLIAGRRLRAARHPGRGPGR